MRVYRLFVAEKTNTNSAGHPIGAFLAERRVELGLDAIAVALDRLEVDPKIVTAELVSADLEAA